MDKELKDRIEELDWFIIYDLSQDEWVLRKESPLGVPLFIHVRPGHFLEDVKTYAEKFSPDGYVHWLSSCNQGFTYSRMVDDAKDVGDMYVDLYNSIKDLEVFNGNTRAKS